MTLRIAVVDDYEIVVSGLARMLEPYDDRVTVVEIIANDRIDLHVDLALYDAFAQGEADHEGVQQVIDNPLVARTVMYTWNFHAHLLAAARSRGVSGYLSKAMSAPALVEALERVDAGQFVTSVAPPRGRSPGPGDWPGRTLGLTERESEVLALITQGFDTRRIAATMFLSSNSIKTHIKSLYRRIDVHSRADAVLWGIDHGFRPDRTRIVHPDA